MTAGGSIEIPASKYVVNPKCARQLAQSCVGQHSVAHVVTVAIRNSSLPQTGAMSSSGSVVGDDVSSESGGRAAFAPPTVVREGRDRIWVLVAVDGGVSSGVQCGSPPPWAAGCAEPGLVVGLAVGPAWHLAAPEDEPGSAAHRDLRAAAARATKAVKVHGYIEYPIKAFAALADPAPPPQAPPVSIVTQMAPAAVSKVGGDTPAQVATALEFLRHWKSQGISTDYQVVRIAPEAAALVTDGQLKCLHSVAITARVNRQALLVEAQPSVLRLRRFTATLGTAVAKALAPSPLRPPREEPGLVRTAHSAQVILEWLGASSHVKDVRRISAATASFSRIFARGSGMGRERLLANLEKVGPETLRRARVRLDAVAMLLFRRLWRDQVRAAGVRQMNLYLFADASPQWRGLELYASTMEMFDGTRVTRKLLPMVSLSKEFMDASGKTLALLWQLFLMFGPDFATMRQVCSRVRSITTDCGVERHIVDMPDCLGDFMWLVDARFEAIRRALCPP